MKTTETEEISEPENETALQVVESNVAIFDSDPVKAYNKMQVVVESIAKKLEGKNYISVIQGNDYPKVEWWTTVGASLGLFPVTEWSRRIERDDEILYEARVSVRHNGAVITAGEAICSNLESNKVTWDEHAVKSMSITRATSKAYRIGLSMLAVMAGLKPTPAEEMENVKFDDNSYGDDGYGSGYKSKPEASKKKTDNKNEWTGEEIIKFGEFKGDKWNNPNIPIERLEFYAEKNDPKYDNRAQFELDRREKSKSESTDNTKDNPKIRFMREMVEAKQALGDNEYYSILSTHGFEHSNLVPTTQEMDVIFTDMNTAINQNEEDDDLPF